jgi:hypothetical protein
MDKIFGTESTLSEGSKKLYLSKLRSISGQKEIKNLLFLKDTEAVIKAIEAKSDNPNTQRTAYIAVCNVLKDKKPFKKQYDKYHEKMMELNGTLNKESHKSDKTKEKQENVSMDKLVDRHEELMKLLPEIKKKKKILPDDLLNVFHLLVTSLYTMLPPRRNKDYQEMVVAEPSQDKELNYYHNGKFYFNNYKTKTAHGQQIINVPTELQEIITVWLKIKPSSPYLLVFPHWTATEGIPITKSNDMLSVIRKSFDNKDVGVSVLRNVYLTSKYGKMSKELKADTEAMGTSVQVANSTYIKS